MKRNLRNKILGTVMAVAVGTSLMVCPVFAEETERPDNLVISQRPAVGPVICPQPPKDDAVIPDPNQVYNEEMPDNLLISPAPDNMVISPVPDDETVEAEVETTEAETEVTETEAKEETIVPATEAPSVEEKVKEETEDNYMPFVYGSIAIAIIIGSIVIYKKKQ